jgi:hypothetical protein
VKASVRFDGPTSDGMPAFFGGGANGDLAHALGQLSRTQRARLCSLISPAASDIMIAVAWAGSGLKRTSFLRGKTVMVMKAARLLPSTKAIPSSRFRWLHNRCHVRNLINNLK